MKGKLVISRYYFVLPCPKEDRHELFLVLGDKSRKVAVQFQISH